MAPLQDQTFHHSQFSTFIATQEIDYEESEALFDSIVSLFATTLAIQVANNAWKSDTCLAERSFLAVPKIVTLLEFCLDLVFWGSFYRQIHGMVMGTFSQSSHGECGTENLSN